MLEWRARSRMLGCWDGGKWWEGWGRPWGGDGLVLGGLVVILEFGGEMR